MVTEPTISTLIVTTATCVKSVDTSKLVSIAVALVGVWVGSMTVPCIVSTKSTNIPCVTTPRKTRTITTATSMVGNTATTIIKLTK